MLGRRTFIDRELARWEKAGWVGAEGAAAIRADLEARSRTGPRLAGILAILGAVLLGFAAMSFVAANWPAMPKLARLALLFCALWASYGGAAALFRRGLDGFAHAAVLLGIAVYGAAIMLIAQMYHIEGNPPDAVLWWGLGALAAGLLLRSNPALAAALVLFCVWSGWEMASDDRIHWPFLLAWAAVAGGIALTRWKAGLHLLSLAMAGWVAALGYQLDSQYGHLLVVLIGLLLCGTSVAAGPAIDRIRQVSGAMLGYGMALTFAGLFALQFAEDPSLRELLMLAALTLALLVGALVWGWAKDHRAALWLGYVGFSIEIFALYVKKLGTLMSTSAFFLVAGLLVVALSALAYRLHRHTGASAEASPS
jgi:uncharacterized membrane protein